MLQEADQPFLVDLVEERSDVGVQYEAHLLAVDSDAQRIQRIMRAAPSPKSVRDAEKVFLVDRVQQRDHRPLDDLVLQRGDRERALSSVRLGYVNAPARQRPIRSPLDPVAQILELALEVCLVVRPRQPIHAGCSVLLKLEERLFEQLDADVMEERGEPLLLPFPCHFPYAFQRLFHAYPVLRPARAVMIRISLGPRPWLHRLRCARPCRRLHSGLLRFVRRLHSYYDGVRLLVSVHHRLRLLTFPMRTAVLGTQHSTTTVRHETSQVPMRSLCT